MPKRSERSEPSASSTSSKNPSFVDIDEIRDVNGLVAIISQRIATGALTFSIKKEFERDGQISSSAFVGEHLIDAYLRIGELVKERIAEIREKGLAPLKDGDARIRPAAAR